MKQAVKRAAAVVLGWAFIVLGVIGLFLPIMQGILFLMIGLTILSTEYVWAHHLLSKVRGRFPKIAHLADRAREKVTSWFHRSFRQEETP